MRDSELILTIYEPRWHGFARWTLSDQKIDDRIKNGPPLISANFVIPYPPGFPIMVPGQIITAETVAEASETVKGIKGIWIEGMQGVVEGGKITAYRVNAKITFEVETNR